MGNFYVNFTTRGPDRDSIAKCLRSANRRAFVTPTLDGLTVFVDERADWQSEEAITDLGKLVSKELDAPVFAVRNHDDDVLCYWLFEDGNITDEYNSCPGYFAGDEMTPAGGDVKTLCAAFRVPRRANQVEKVLRNEEYLFALLGHKDLAVLLNIPWPFVCLVYRDIEAGDLPCGLSKKELSHLDQRLV